MEKLGHMIKDFHPFGEIKQHIIAHKHELSTWRDATGLDLLHCAIWANYQEVAQLLLHFHVRNEEYIPSPPYLHYAARLGRAALCSKLLEYFPEDLERACYQRDIHDSDMRPPGLARPTLLGVGDAGLSKLNINGASHKSNIQHNDFNSSGSPSVNDNKGNCATSSEVPSEGSRCRCSVVEDGKNCDDKEESLLTAVDIAAIYGHYNCLSRILSVDSLELKGKTLLERACEINSYHCVRYLLNTKRTEFSQTEAFNLALRHRHPKCVDLLLSNNVDYENVFNGMNLYHVLFTYTSGFLSYRNGRKVGDRHANLEECTRVLLSHDIDPRRQVPSSTYPLYSLISAMARGIESGVDATVPEPLINTLQLLFQAGVDPLFVGELDTGIFGWDGHKSAFQVLYGGNYCWLFNQDCLYKITNILLMNTPDVHAEVPSDPPSCSPFRSFLRFVANCPRLAEFKWRRHASLWLRHGVNLDTPPPSDRFFAAYREAVNAAPTERSFYWSCFAQALQRHVMAGCTAPQPGPPPAEVVKSNERAWLAERLDILLYFLRYSDHVTALAVLQEHRRLGAKTFTSGLPTVLVDDFSRRLQVAVTTVQELGFLCRKLIWRLIGRRQERLHRLGLPNSLVTSFLTMFD